MAVTYSPNFNLSVAFWDNTNADATGPPTIPAIPGQLYVHSRNDTPVAPSAPQIYTPSVFMRIPTSAMVLIGATGLVPGFLSWVDIVGNVWYYKIRWWEWTHAGFPNQYASLCIEQCDIAGLTPDANR